MREKFPCVVVTFRTTTQAMAMERYCLLHAIPGRLIPVPPSIMAGCGMCWKAPLEARSAIEAAAKDLHLENGGVYEMLLS